MLLENQSQDNHAEFSSWKWKVLQRRREFFVPLLATLSLFLWIFLAATFSNSNTVGVSTKGVVLTMTQLTALLVLGLVLTPRHKTVLSGNFGYKICIMLILSVFPLIYTFRKFSSGDNFFSEVNGVIVMSFVSLIWLTCVHHIGLTELSSWAMGIAILLMWLLFADGRDNVLNSISLVSISFGCLLLPFCSSLLEAEYRDIYALQNEAVERSLNDVTFIEDVASVLNDMSELLNQVSRIGSLGRASSKLSHAGYLCSSVFGAAIGRSGEDNDSHNEMRSDVELSTFFAGTIEKMESLLGRGCSMYYDPSSAEVCINTRKHYLEQILLLLAEDSVSVELPPSICLYSFQSVNNNLHIILRRLAPEGQTFGEVVSNKNQSAADGSDEGQRHSTEEAFLQTLVAEKDQKYAVYNTARFRLADRIARKHLKSKVDMAAPESKQGLTTVTMRIVLPGPVSIPSIGEKDNTQEEMVNANLVHLTPWYVVEYYKATDDKLYNVKNQLDMLGVPWKSVHAYHFSTMKTKTQVAVVHEMWFQSHKEKVFNEVYSLARAVLVVSSENDAMKTVQYSQSGGAAKVIKVSASITARDLFSAIQSLIVRMKPVYDPQKSRRQTSVITPRMGVEKEISQQVRF